MQIPVTAMGNLAEIILHLGAKPHNYPSQIRVYAGKKPFREKNAHVTLYQLMLQSLRLI